MRKEILMELGLEDVPSVKVPEHLVKALKEFSFSNKRFLVLWGPAGTYKTTAVKKFLYALAKSKLSEKGMVSEYDCKFVRFADLMKIWQEGEEALHKTKILAIDDLIFSGYPDVFWLKIFGLIDYRYTKDCKTIITTNHDLRFFLEGEVSLRQRISSRLCDENLSMLVLSASNYRTPNQGGISW
jgi:DNA replication protein DnaC